MCQEIVHSKVLLNEVGITKDSKALRTALIGKLYCAIYTLKFIFYHDLSLGKLQKFF